MGKTEFVAEINPAVSGRSCGLTEVIVLTGVEARHDNIDIDTLAKTALAEAFRKGGHVHVRIAGRTGVGKSTLINAM